MPYTIRRLESSHFAFYRAYLEGPEALDLPALADRYLDCGRDPRRVRALLRWLQDEFAAAARRNGDWEALRLLRLPKTFGERETRTASDSTPTLSEFAAQVDPDNVFGEAELIALYRDRFPEAGDARARKAARLRGRRLSALRRLQQVTVDAPFPVHPVDGWFDANIVNRLHKAGIETLAQLCETINGHGVRWYRDIPALGPIGAARIVRWVQGNAASLGDVVPRHRAEGSDAAPVGRVQGRCAILPIEALSTEPLSDALSGAHGSNRASPGALTIDVGNDVDAVLAWIATQAASVHTRRAYRTQAERILLWSVVACGKPLSSLDAEDLAAYEHFMTAPPAAWVAPRHTPRWSVRWRPFAGPLNDSSRSTASNVLKALFRWLVRVGYLRKDPTRHDAVAAASTDRMDRGGRASDAPMATGVSVRRDTRMQVQVARSVDALHWGTLAQFGRDATTLRDQRAFCMLALSQAVGLRLQEIVALRMGDLSLPPVGTADATVTVAPRRALPDVDGTGGTGFTRTQVMPSWLNEALQRYLGHCENDTMTACDTARPLFGSLKPRPVAQDSAAENMPVLHETTHIGSVPSWQAGWTVAPERRMHATTLAREIRHFVRRLSESIDVDQPALARAIRRITSGACRHGFVRTALYNAVPPIDVQAALGLRSRTTINAHRRALAVRPGASA